MVSGKEIRWLSNELPKLVEAGVLRAEAAEAVRDYYQSQAKQSRRPLGLIICGVLGAILIGLGIVLIFAHNWEYLSRSSRMVLSFVPLIAGQFVVGWTILRHPDSVPWREGSSLFLMGGIGAGIALIGRTCNFPTDMAAYLLTWMLLSVPLVYLVRATVPAALYWIGLTAWAGFAQSQAGQAVLFWPLAALILPHYWWAYRLQKDGARMIALGWVLCLCLSVALGITLAKSMPGLWIAAYASLYSIFCLASVPPKGEPVSIWRRPYSFAGRLGTIVVAFLLTYEWPWEKIGWKHERTGFGYHDWAAIVDYVVAVGLLIALILLLATSVRRKRAEILTFGSFGLFAAVLYVLVSVGLPQWVALLVFNVYLLALGVLIIRQGLRVERRGTINFGLLIAAVLIIARFFDADIPFTVRAIGFIVVGVGFLVVNLLVSRRRSAA
jgi:hypothetical protein